MSPAAPASLIVHGHFYQPPRENPWTEEVELQASAAPYHDWNERIAVECYTPNGWARLLDGEERIVRLINNYAAISFDIGPTLCRWFEQHTPETYRRIIQGDRESRSRHGGHGGALAHPYVHAILPLTDLRDRSTLIKWGIADFQRRFGRKPDGMWLPETAVDLATLQLLADHGIRFTILAPSQAVRFRPSGQGNWIEVGPEGIDPGRPYRCVLPGGGSIALFFYDSALSRAVAFEELLKGPDRLAGRVVETSSRSPSRLRILCTDGESYGHHTPFGERALAALIARRGASGDLAITNFGAYLQGHPPDHEVIIREGSAWSCAHGLGRWKEDCGCSTGGQPGWGQGWRVYLRAALDGLREELHRVFVEQGERYFTDAWGARDSYIDLILDRNPRTVEAFVMQHARGSLSPEEWSAVLQLLEMQRHALLMQTSCGWFFDDISGIEPVQNLRHAARAIELASPFTTENIEARFLAELQSARSNVPMERDGRRIWEVHVRTARVPLTRLAVFYAARSLADGLPDPYRLYGFTLHRLALERRPTTGGTVVVGGVEVRSIFTLQREEFGFVLRWSDADGMAGHLFPWKGEGEIQRWREIIDTEADHALPQGHPQGVPISLKVLSPEERQQVLMALYEGRVEENHKVYDELAARNRGLLAAFVNEGLSPPEPLRTPADYILARDLEARLREWLSDGGPEAHRALLALAEEARRLGLPQRDQVQGMLTRSCVARMQRLRDHPDLDRFRGLQEVLDLGERLGCTPHGEEITILVEEILAHQAPRLIELLLQSGFREQYDMVSALLRLGERFGFATQGLRQRLRPIEERLAADPGLWP
ncbi:MAG: DUF3536 domain-containing protein [Candidatus Methylomirabilis oxyfera]|nr:DUF3536 domain-containing protein [Candidatus Methylomirabilis oxyfera]